ncbi:MAG: YncE family protein, partial [Candidatus Acidiferrales bacterium]
TSGYHLLDTYKLGGEGGWDYLSYDSDSNRLFISRSTHVMVMDGKTGKLVGDIPDTPGVHGIALVNSLNRGFISNGRGNSVTVFNLMSLQTLETVPVGQNPDAIIFDMASDRVFTMNGHSNDATAIDAVTDKVVGTIHLGGKPEFAVSDEAGHIYVNIEDKSEVVQIDSEGLRVTARWPLKPCQEPSALAIDRANNRLFAGCHNDMMAVMDAHNGFIIATIPIGKGVDAGAFDPGTNYIFMSNGDGTLTVTRAESAFKFSLVENVDTQRGARTMALDPQTHTVYLVTAQFGPAPAPTADNPHPRPAILPDSFVVLAFGK